MGMYTELVCAFELKNNVPKDIINILNYMCEGDDDFLNDVEIPNHELFKTSRWDFMLRSDSYYFDGATHSFLKTDYLYPDKPMYYLNVRCNLKDYDNEIDKFIDWLKPYIDKDKENMFIGYKRYETENEPTLIYV
jgi:hypothetical protein